MHARTAGVVIFLQLNALTVACLGMHDFSLELQISSVKPKPMQKRLTRKFNQATVRNSHLGSEQEVYL